MQTMILGQDTLRKTACGFLALMFTGMAQAQTVILVSGGGANLQTAINNANTGDILLVTPGTYWPISTDDKAIRIESTGGATVTIIDGNGTDRCATLGSESGHTNTVLTGFTLQNGYTADNGGGALFGTLNNCTLSGNTAEWGGGGAQSGILNNCTLSDNTAGWGGGAHECTLNNCTLTGNTTEWAGGGADNCTLTDCTLTGNTAGYGGGVFVSTLYNCTLSENVAAEGGGGARGSTLNDCTLTGNTAENDGGGAYDSTLNNCVVVDNTATWGGGVSGSTLYNCTLSENVATADGGGAWHSTLNNCTIKENTARCGGGAFESTLNNCLVAGNKAEGLGRGGGVALWGGTRTLNNCTVVGNSAENLCGGIYHNSYGDYDSGGILTLNNCIVWGNSAPFGDNFDDDAIIINHSCTDFDPMFVNAENGDFRLQSGSPCINAGDNAYAVGNTDLDGNVRIWDGTVDMGAYEYGAPPVRNVTLYGEGTFADIGALPCTLTCTNTYDSLPETGTRTGYTFNGWTNSTGTVVNNGMTFAAAGNATELYVRWTLDIYPITYADTKGATNPNPTFYTITNGIAFLPLTDVPEGWIFDGWSPDSIALGSTDARTVTALWTAIAYPINYVNTKGATNPNPAFYTITNGVTFAALPSVEGYTFTGWDVASIAVGSTGEKTITALWTVNIYTLTFDAQDGEVSPDSITVTYGEVYGELPTPTRGDYTFEGWFTKPDGEGVFITETNTVSTASNHVLYACWTDRDPYLSETDGSAGTPSPYLTTAYSGFVYDADNTVRGTMTLNAKAAVKVDKKTNIATTNWTFSAKAVLQNASVSFSGKFTGVATRFNVTTKNGETLDVTVEGGRFYGEIKGGKVGGTFKVDGAKNIFADKKGVPAMVTLPKLMGLYNVALLGGRLSPAAAAGEDARPPVGFVSLSVGNAGAVKLVGQLSDGTKVSGSAKLLSGLNEDGWYAVALHRPLYSKKGFIGGLLWLDVDDLTKKTIRVDSLYGWFVDWVCEDPKKPNFWRELDVLGGYFGDGKNPVMPPPGLKFSADVPSGLPPPVPGLTGGMWIDTVFPWMMPITYDGLKLSLAKGVTPKIPKGETAYDYTGVNPSLATLSYTAKTGVFKGSFKLYYDGVDPKNGKLQHKSVNVPYTGVMVPDNGVLTGLGTGTATINKVKHGMGVRLE